MMTNKISMQIACMNKLKMVRFYQLFGESGLMNGILAYYQDKTINLCDADPGFQELFDRVSMLYAQEVKENPIIADEHTRNILERTGLLGQNEYELLFDGLTEEESPLILPKAYSHVFLLPMIEYILQSLYDKKKESLTFLDLSHQWFGKGILEAMFLREHLQFPFQILEITNDFYEVSLLNVLQAGNLLKFQIFFDNQGISVSYFDQYFLFSGNLRFVFDGQTAKLIHSLSEKDQVLIQREDFLEKQEGKHPTDLLRHLVGQGESGWLSYELPWGATYFQTEDGGKCNRIYFTEDSSIRIGLLNCFEKISKANEKPICFGHYSLHVYERNDIAEIHTCDMAYPRNSFYAENYAGKYYLAIHEGKGYQNGKL